MPPEEVDAALTGLDAPDRVTLGSEVSIVVTVSNVGEVPIGGDGSVVSVTGVTNRDDLIDLGPVELPAIPVGESGTVTLDDWIAVGTKPYKVDWTATVTVEGDENAANDTATALTKVRR